MLAPIVLQCLQLGDQRIAQAATGLRHPGGRASRDQRVTHSTVRLLFRLCTTMYTAQLYSNVQHCTSPLGSASAQRAALPSGRCGMGLFDAATPLQKRKRNQRVPCLSAAMQTGEEPVTRPREASDGRTLSSILLWCAPVVGQSKPQQQQQQQQQQQILAVPPSTVTFTAAHPPNLGGAATHRH